MANLYDVVFKPKTITLENGHSVVKKATRTPVIIIFVVALTLLAADVTGFSLSVLMKRGHQFFVILQQIFMPDPEFAWNVFTPLFNTIQMSIMGSAIGCVLALPYAVLSSSNITNKAVVTVCRFFLSILRTLPTLVMALIATLIFNMGTFAGTVAIALFTFGMVSKMTYEYIETLDMGAYEALEALGADKFRAFWSGIFPAVLPNFLSTCLYCVETTIRHAAVLGYVGAGGIGLLLNENLGWREYHKVGTILLMLFIAVLIIENISRFLRKKLVRGDGA